MDNLLSYWSNSSLSSKAALGLGGFATAAVVFLLFRARLRRNAVALIKTDYQSDVVYFYQFPSCRTIVTISPYALKLETWLRWKKIPYESRRGIDVFSKYGQIPFVELNGEQIADSNIIIQALEKHFDKADNVSVEERSIARAFEMMLENQTVYSYFFYRYVIDAAKFIGTWEFLGALARYFVGKFFPKAFTKRVKEHGIGRHSDEDIYDFGFQDLKAISDFLGDKKYFFGDQMSKTDCYLFGHLCQILFVPVEYPHKEYIAKHSTNLISYTHRLKDEFWSDWDRVCADNLQAK